MPISNTRQGASTRLEPISTRRASPPAARPAPTPRPDEQPILSIRTSVAKGDAARFIAEALHDIRAFMQEHDIHPVGPPFSICVARGDDLEIEAGWPTTARLAGTTRIHAGLLPRGLTRPRINLDRTACP